MSKKQTLTQSLIERSQTDGKTKDLIIWDTLQAGLGLKITLNNRKSFVFRYRMGGRETRDQRHVIGTCAEINLKKARELAADYAFMIRKGIDPFAEKEKGLTVYQLFQGYVKRRKAGQGREKKLSPGTAYEWERLGAVMIAGSEIEHLPIRTFGLADANRFFDAQDARPVSANRILVPLRLAWSDAIKQGLLPLGNNPWEYMDKYKEEPKRVRFEPGDDVKMSSFLDAAWKGKVLDRQGGKISRYWIGLIWMLFYTGARPEEVCTLRHEYIQWDSGIARLPNSKTGEKEILLSKPALEWLARMEKVEGNPFVFVSEKSADGHITNYWHLWDLMREHTGIKAPVYALRRNFASESRRILNDADLAISSKIIGHADAGMTAVYAGEDQKAKAKERKVIKLANEKVGRKLRDKHRISTGKKTV